MCLCLYLPQTARNEGFVPLTSPCSVLERIVNERTFFFRLERWCYNRRYKLHNNNNNHHHHHHHHHHHRNNNNNNNNGVGEVLRRIVGKGIAGFLKEEIIEAAAPFRFAQDVAQAQRPRYTKDTRSRRVRRTPTTV